MFPLRIGSVRAHRGVEAILYNPASTYSPYLGNSNPFRRSRGYSISRCNDDGKIRDQQCICPPSRAVRQAAMNNCMDTALPVRSTRCLSWWTAQPYSLPYGHGEGALEMLEETGFPRASPGRQCGSDWLPISRPWPVCSTNKEDLRAGMIRGAIQLRRRSAPRMARCC